MVESLPPSAYWARHSRVGLDTNILIYLVQDHPHYADWCESFFRRILQGETTAVTSTVSLLEALVQPYRLQDDRLAEKFYALLYSYPGLVWSPVSIEIAGRAAKLRARYNLSTPDAIQLATALDAGATGFIGNDKGLKQVREIECLALDEVV